MVWLHGEITTPPFSSASRVEVGALLRRLQRGDKLGLPHSRPLPEIGSRCHELRIPDTTATWRIIYRLDADAVVIVAVFSKKTSKLPAPVIKVCRQRLREYDEAAKE